MLCDEKVEMKMDELMIWVWLIDLFNLSGDFSDNKNCVTYLS